MAPLSGQDIVLKNLVAIGGGFTRHVNKAMKKVEATLGAKVRESMSLECHSLEELAMMGHPYSTRHYRQIHSPAWLVHKQSGQLLDSFTSGTREAKIYGSELSAAAWAGVDADKAPHAWYVVMGTWKMVPRDFVWLGYKEVEGEINDTIEGELRAAVVEHESRMA